MKRILITVCLLFGLIVSANAGTLYSCIDQEGKAIVTSSPQDGMRDCVAKDSQDDSAYGDIKEKPYYSDKSSERAAKEENYRRKRQKEDCEKECYETEQSCFKSCDNDYKKNYSGRNFCRRGCADTRDSCKKNRCN